MQILITISANKAPKKAYKGPGVGGGKKKASGPKASGGGGRKKGKQSFFDKLNPKQQKEYIKAHPKSQYAKDQKIKEIKEGGSEPTKKTKPTKVKPRPKAKLSTKETGALDDLVGGETDSVEDVAYNLNLNDFDVAPEDRVTLEKVAGKKTVDALIESDNALEDKRSEMNKKVSKLKGDKKIIERDKLEKAFLKDGGQELQDKTQALRLEVATHIKNQLS